MSQQTEEKAKQPAKEESFADILKTVVYALLIAIAFRTVLYQPFSIPSGSMKPSLLIGDYLFVSKASYGYSRYSLPFGRLVPEWLFPGRIFSSEPERGDVIVFRNPNELGEDYIKRVIGLPGDRIQVRDSILYINGSPVDLSPAEPFIEPRNGASQACLNGSGDACAKTQLVETLPNGVQHAVLDAGRTDADNTCVYTVPTEQYFFMGDNRDNSIDSRFGADRAFIGCTGAVEQRRRGIGFVPRDLLIGRAEFILLSSEGAFWELWNWRGDRFFKAIE